MRKSLGDKRREIPLDRERDVLEILSRVRDGDTRRVAKDGKEEDVVVSRIFPTTHFGFRKITVDRPRAPAKRRRAGRCRRRSASSCAGCRTRSSRISRWWRTVDSSS
jgi:hypothetical protein